MLAPLGLRLSPEKTAVGHQLGHDSLGFHIRRQRKRGTQKWYVYTRPSRKAIQSIRIRCRKRRTGRCRHQDLDELLRSLNMSLAGWANHFRHGVSKAIFSAVTTMRGTGDALIRAKYAGKSGLSMKQMRRRFCDADGGSPATGSCSPAPPASR